MKLIWWVDQFLKDEYNKISEFMYILRVDIVCETLILVIKRCVLDHKIKILKIKAIGLELFIIQELTWTYSDSLSLSSSTRTAP